MLQFIHVQPVSYANDKPIKVSIMHHHNYIPAIEPKESPIQGIIIAIACLAVFAFWGVLLALGI